MKLSPQSDAVVQRLLAKQPLASGKLSIGPLNDASRALLTVFVDHFEELTRLKGEERARKLRQRYASQIAAVREALPAPDPGAPRVSSPPLLAPMTSPEWRLVTLRCTSVRGIAPPGESFEFSLDGHSCLIYGPNGSGKSSLLSAIIWVLTGAAIVDTANAAEQAPLYALPTGKTSGAKLRDWPIVATLPDVGDVSKAMPACRAELLLQCAVSGTTVGLRRCYGSEPEVSTDGRTWNALGDISALGIEPLDVQLSLIAPTIFGRRSIEEADNTRSILSLMLGFDDLEQLGELASQLSTNRTRLANLEKRAIEAKNGALLASLRLLPAQLPDGSEAAKTVEDLLSLPNLKAACIDATIAQLEDAVKKAESHLAEALGLSLGAGAHVGGLADRLTVAVDGLSKGFDLNFPSLVELRLPHALPTAEQRTPTQRLEALRTDLRSFVAASRAAIAERYNWWLEENAPGSKFALLLKASQYFDPEDGKCPVCERPIDNPLLRERLQALRKLDTAAGAELRTFFVDLLDALNHIVPKAVADVSSKTLQQRIDKDWSQLRDSVLGEAFVSLSGTCESHIGAAKSKAEPPSTPSLNVLPDSCDNAFALAASTFLARLQSAQDGIVLLTWCAQNLTPLCDDIAALTTSGEAPGSLLVQLSNGKAEAALVKPLVVVCRELQKLRTEQATIDQSLEQLKLLEELSDPLDQLKRLSKYAETVVQAEFDTIKGTTAANLKYLYPEASTGMRPGNLRLGKGKDKSVEALLTCGACEVPGQYFANAGLQRAVALAFYFALLEKHRGGIGFIIMDDPILSLDEDHRERWAIHLLRPKLEKLQVILATHQRVFLQHCAHDFTPGRVVELNPRSHNRRISYKPGIRLQRAEQQLRDGDWLAAAVTMRKFREDVLISLDAFCESGLFDSSDLAASMKRYQHLPANHPLASDAQQKICLGLTRHEVGYVLDPAAHSKTEADVTKANAEDCLTHLAAVSAIVAKELARLESLRVRSLRSSTIQASLASFDKLDPRVIWSSTIAFPVIGATAAKSTPWSVELSTSGDRVYFGEGAAVQVTGDSLEPVARFGQWALLAEEHVTLNDGDLVAVRDEDGGRYLRRLWSNEREWILQSINPVRPIPSLTVAKRLIGIRRIIGILYRPLGRAKQKAGDGVEWSPCFSLNASDVLKQCRVIDVVGDSLDPIARNGQKVLVDQPLANPSSCADGELVVVEFEDETLGSVIKRAFPNKDRWTLVSPNPVDCLPPKVVASTAIRMVWIVRGVLFEVASS